MKFRIVEYLSKKGKQRFKIEERLFFIWCDLRVTQGMHVKNKFKKLVKAEQYIDHLKNQNGKKIIKSI